MSIKEIPTDYRATLEGAVFYPQTGAGILRLDDLERLDFLQRNTTNDLKPLNPEHSLLTVLVSPTARILDVLCLVADGEHILALTLPEHGAATLAYLQKRIFFRDKVRLADASQEFSQFDLEGPKLASVLVNLGFYQAPGIDQVLESKYEGISLRAIGQRGLAGLGVRLLVSATDTGSIKDALVANGAVQLTAESHETLRVEAGLPAAQAELSEAYTPLEVSLEHAVSGSKGCYPGQEVIARQITYDKITRKMVGLRLEAPTPRGARLSVESAPAGEITSAVISPRFGPIALGVVKRPHYEVGTILEAQVEGQDKTVQAEVVDTPFRK